MLRLIVSLLLLSLSPGISSAKAFRTQVQVLGQSAAIEVRGVERQQAAPALQAASETLRRVIAELADPSADEPLAGPRGLNQLAGRGAVELEPDLAELLAKSLDFCLWSQGANGPLGGHVFQLVERRISRQAEEWKSALASAACDGLLLDRQQSRGELLAGRRLDLRNFALGFAIDRSVAALKSAGIVNGKVGTEFLIRAFGDGPDGKGWLIALPQPRRMDSPLQPIRLHDQAFSAVVPTLDDGTNSNTLPLNLRDGSLSTELLAVYAITDLALDAQGLALSFFALGSREGEFRAGLLRPLPSLLWLFGGEEGYPLLSSVRWSQVDSPRTSAPKL